MSIYTFADDTVSLLFHGDFANLNIVEKLPHNQSSTLLLSYVNVFVLQQHLNNNFEISQCRYSGIFRIIDKRLKYNY